MLREHILQFKLCPSTVIEYIGVGMLCFENTRSRAWSFPGNQQKFFVEVSKPTINYQNAPSNLVKYEL